MCVGGEGEGERSGGCGVLCCAVLCCAVLCCAVCVDVVSVMRCLCEWFFFKVHLLSIKWIFWGVREKGSKW